jgi:hypothetical protein
MSAMMEACVDPLHFLVDRLCCRVYLDGCGNVRLGFSRRHGLAEMMTAQGIARSNASLLHDQLCKGQGVSGVGTDAAQDTPLSGHVANGDFCPLV